MRKQDKKLAIKHNLRNSPVDYDQSYHHHPPKRDKFIFQIGALVPDRSHTKVREGIEATTSQS